MWEKYYYDEKEILCEKIKDYLSDIQHIGSTSIVGMPSKPILDIGLAVKELTIADEKITPLLEELGYIARGELGIKGRRYFVKGPDHKRTHHIHLYEENNENWLNHLRFRDFLRQEKKYAQQYAALKIKLWKKYKTDRAKYTESKNDFITNILKLAKNK